MMMMSLLNFMVLGALVFGLSSCWLWPFCLVCVFLKYSVSVSQSAWLYAQTPFIKEILASFFDHLLGCLLCSPGPLRVLLSS
jgi:hypothetical protein